MDKYEYMYYYTRGMCCSWENGTHKTLNNELFTNFFFLLFFRFHSNAMDSLVRI